jgi:UDP-galactose transporter B1
MRSDLKTTGILLFCTAGIYAAYLTQGVVQERLAIKRFGPDER